MKTPPENAERLRIVFLIDWFFYYTAPIATSLSENADVRCILRDHGSEMGLSRTAEEEKAAILGSIPTDFVRGRQYNLCSLIPLLRLVYRLRKLKPDVIHAQWHSDWRFLALSLAAPRALRVLTVHDVTPHPGAQFHTTPLKRLVRNIVYRYTDAFLVHGRMLVRQLEQDPHVPRSAYFGVVPHGSLAQPSAPSELPRGRSLLFFGRWEYYKGLDILIPAVEEAGKILGDLKVIVAGQGSEGEYARSLVRNPEFFDWREGFVRDSDLPSLFGSVSAVVLPYREASQSGVVPLAFANRRPVIATNVGALGEAVSDGVNGILVKSATVGEIRDAILRIFTEPLLLEKLANGAHSTATGSHSPTELARAHRAAYNAARLAKETGYRR